MAAGVNKLHLPLVAWPTHPQCHVVEGRAVTKEAPQPQNAILFIHTDPSSKGLGQGNLYPELSLELGRILDYSQYSLAALGLG